MSRPVMSRVVMVVSLLPASVDADLLGFMIPQVNPILQVSPCKTHIISSCQVGSLLWSACRSAWPTYHRRNGTLWWR